MSLDWQSPRDFEPIRERARASFFEHREVIESAHELAELKDPNEILETFSDIGLIENMVVQKGKQGIYLDILVDAFDSLLLASSGKQFSEIGVDDMQKLVDSGLPPLVFSEIAGAYFHLKNDRGYRLAGMSADENGFGSNVAAANAFNCLASYEIRRKQYDRSRVLNRHGLDLVKGGVTADEMWQSMKISHGQIDARSRGGVHADMITKFEELLSRRVSLNDTNHIGRTEFEIARLCLELGQFEKALEYTSRTLESASKTHYSNLEVDAVLLETKIHRAMGDFAGSRLYFLQAQTSGRDLGIIRAAELEAENEMLEKSKVSVFCQIQFPDGKYLTLVEGGAVRPVLIELASGKNVEGAIREELEKLLKNLCILGGLKENENIHLSVRNTRLKFQYKENIGTEDAPHRNMGYEISLPESSAIIELSRALDKNPVLCYGISDSQPESLAKE